MATRTTSHTSVLVAAEQARPAESTARLAYLDNIRLLLTVLVVAHHAGLPYGSGQMTALWPFADPNVQRSPLLDPFFAVNSAFFMGLFFFIAGYFTPASLRAKGAWRFIGDRLLRLGIPLVVFVVAYIPFAYLIFDPAAKGLSFGDYLLSVYIGTWRIEIAHLWFIAHLLVFSIVFACLHQLWQPPARRWSWVSPFNHRRSPATRDQELRTGAPYLGFSWPGSRLYLPVTGNTRSSEAIPTQMAPPDHRAIAGYTALLAIVTFAVRVQFPIDSWVPVLGIRTEPAHLPQYISLFLVGIIARGGDWLDRFPTVRGIVWLALGIAAAGLRYAYGIASAFWPLPPLISLGGLDWRSLLWSCWESIICVGLCVGLLVLFRERAARQSPLVRGLAGDAYAVYIIHLGVVYLFQAGLMVLAPHAHPLLKFAAVALLAVAVTFPLGRWLRGIPALRRIL